jgi:hypothetical protein
MPDERTPLLAEHAAQRDHGTLQSVTSLDTVVSSENGHGHGDIETSVNGTIANPGAGREDEAENTPAPSTLFLMSMVSHSLCVRTLHLTRAQVLPMSIGIFLAAMDQTIIVSCGSFDMSLKKTLCAEIALFSLCCNRKRAQATTENILDRYELYAHSCQLPVGPTALSNLSVPQTIMFTGLCMGNYQTYSAVNRACCRRIRYLELGLYYVVLHGLWMN